MCDAVNDEWYSYNSLEYVVFEKEKQYIFRGPCFMCMHILGYPPPCPSYFSGSPLPGMVASVSNCAIFCFPVQFFSVFFFLFWEIFHLVLKEGRHSTYLHVGSPLKLRAVTLNPRRHKVKKVTRRHGGGSIGPLPSTFDTICPID